MNNINLIGLSGQLQNGKDTVADLILKHTSTYNEEIEEFDSVWYTKRFAGILKKMTAMIIGCNVSELEKDSFKNTPLGEEWRRWFFIGDEDDGEYNNKRVTDYYGSKDEAMEANPFLTDFMLRNEILTPRLVLQLLGTEGGREQIHPNIWVNATLGDIKPTDKIIVTDVRFPNEVYGIKKRNGIVIRVVRPSKVSTSTHPSETSLNDFNQWDYVIINDGTLEQLEDKVIEMLKHFGILDVEYTKTQQ